MNSNLTPKEMQGVYDVWQGIVNKQDEPEPSVETPETPPEPYEAGTGHLDMRKELEASGKFSSDEIENILNQ